MEIYSLEIYNIYRPVLGCIYAMGTINPIYSSRKYEKLYGENMSERPLCLDSGVGRFATCQKYLAGVLTTCQKTGAKSIAAS